jgi:hypothetical protein
MTSSVGGSGRKIVSTSSGFGVIRTQGNAAKKAKTIARSGVTGRYVSGKVASAAKHSKSR